MKENKRNISLHAVALRWIALICMLLDHLWATVVPGNLWMTCLGRLAFPIFAFQAAEGYYRTSNLKRYLCRLLVFGVISELPFNLMLSGSWVYPFHQNVMFTMALGLLGIRAMEQARSAGCVRERITAVLSMLLWIGLGAVTLVDYGAYGVITVMLFAACRYLPGAKLFQLAGMVVIHVFWMKGMTIPVLGLEFPLQGFAVLALLPIWLYHGEKGPRNKMVQYGSYLFYPLHLLVLGIICQIL